MTTTKPQVNPTDLYNQRQAAELLQVERHTVARYEQNGYIRFAVRKAGGGKVTTGAQIIKCWESCYVMK